MRGSVVYADIMHGFFHDRNLYKSYSRCSCDGGVFISYSTVIAQRMTAPGGEVVFLSSERFSSSTQRHICLLKEACPPDITILWYPSFVQDRHWAYTLDELKQGYREDFLWREPKDMSLERNRVDYKPISDSFKKFLRLFDVRRDDDALKDAIDRMEELDDALEKAEGKLEELREKRRANAVAAAEKRIGQMKSSLDKLAKAVEGKTVAELVKMSKQTGGPLNKDERSYLWKWLLSDIGKFSGATIDEFIKRWLLDEAGKSRRMRWAPWWTLVWRNSRFVRTTKDVTVPIEEVETAFGVYDRLTDKSEFKDYKIGGFKVSSSDSSVLVIGCHHIPIENINELRKEVFRK